MFADLGLRTAKVRLIGRNDYDSDIYVQDFEKAYKAVVIVHAKWSGDRGYYDQTFTIWRDGPNSTTDLEQAVRDIDKLCTAAFEAGERNRSRQFAKLMELC